MQPKVDLSMIADKIADLRAEIARLEGENAGMAAALSGIRWRCERAADWQDEVARRLAEALLGVMTRAAWPQ